MPKMKRLHIALGTPMYGGACMAAFNRSTAALALALESEGHKLTPIFLANESLIQRARNTIAYHFLKTDATHLLFVDADTGIRVEDVARMVAANKPIIMAPCPMKRINWARVRQAIADGVPDDLLHRYTGFFNIVHLPGNRTVSADEPFEVEVGGSGFMLIKREVFEKLARVTETYVNRNHGDAMPPGVRVHNFFPVHVVNDDLWSEDYAFCAAWRRLGGSVWAAPWCEVKHVGTYEFAGVFRDCSAAPQTQEDTCRSSTATARSATSPRRSTKSPMTGRPTTSRTAKSSTRTTASSRPASPSRTKSPRRKRK